MLLSRMSSRKINTVTSCGRRALLRRRPKDDEGTQLGREWIRTFIECETRGYIGVVDSRIRHIRRLPDLAVAQCRNDPKPRGSARHESAQLRNTTINTKRQTRFRNTTPFSKKRRHVRVSVTRNKSRRTGSHCSIFGSKNDGRKIWNATRDSQVL